MIYYFCFENSAPTGGNKITYRHVEVLNQLGLSACVVHSKPNFRYSSLQHQPPIIGLDQLQMQHSDLLVLPEDLGPGVHSLAPGARKLIFNQNAYQTFRGYGLQAPQLPPYQHPDYEAVLVVSSDNQRYLETAFPGLQCKRLHISFDQSLFNADLSQPKPRQICLMTRKNAEDVVQIVQILRSRGHLSNWRFQIIQNACEQEVADAMRASAIFLAFGHPEGISLSNLEALASGCLVIGYSGMGCREYFEAGHAIEVPVGDITAFVHAIEAAVHRYETEPEAVLNHCRAAQHYARHTFSAEQEATDLLEAYASLGVQPQVGS